MVAGGKRILACPAGWENYSGQMSMRSEIIARLLNPGVIPVVRAHHTDEVMPACEALLAGGLNALEITMTTPNALEMIREVCRRFGSRAVIGVGTVLNPVICLEAIRAGAEFVVTPIMIPEIARVCQGAERVCILGAFTPTEAQAAYEVGADFVKIFPAVSPAYVGAVLSPLPHLKVVPTSGVNLKTGPEFFAMGCPMVGVGSSLVSSKILQEKNWTELTRLAGEFAAMARKAPRK
jgi:2-dehydro-3-deoxyphosphogluconate aldolase/(4S)-4-hydroxy-2-oxoglutarate aldolase